MKHSKFKQLPKIIYHGTTSYEEQYLSLTNVNTIDLTKGKKRTDFGQGFYVTSIYQQVLVFARYKANFVNDYNDSEVKLERPILIKYQLHIDLMKEFNGKVFPYPNEEWAEFVFNNRIGEKFIISNSHNIDRKYDYVNGHVADGQIAIISNRYKYDKLDINQFCQQIQPKFPTKNEQLSFHSKRTLTCLEFLEVIDDESYRYRGRRTMDAPRGHQRTN